MKNFLILGLLALLLFSVSAALSLWLNQSNADKTEKDKLGTKGTGRNSEGKEPPESHVPPKTDHTPPSGTGDSLNAARERANLERRAAQIEIVIRDMQVQRETVEATLKQVMAELKNATTIGATTKPGDLDALAADLEKQRLEMIANEQKNIVKMAAMYDVMAPETAAPILKQMAESGKLEMAARLLVRMKERQAAQVLTALADPVLATQLLEKIRQLKANPSAIPSGSASPAGAVVPARGP